MMIEDTISRLGYLCDNIPLLLRDVSDKDFSARPRPGKWSKKEILGHLIDSATNNHHRLIRAQFEDTPVIAYDQDRWVQHGYYQQMPLQQLITMWEAYNRQLFALIHLLPQHMLSRPVRTGADRVLNLKELMEDYVVHLEHHLRQILSY